jgi:hypothetical protein
MREQSVLADMGFKHFTLIPLFSSGFLRRFGSCPHTSGKAVQYHLKPLGQEVHFQPLHRHRIIGSGTNRPGIARVFQAR